MLVPFERAVACATVARNTRRCSRHTVAGVFATTVAARGEP